MEGPGLRGDGGQQRASRTSRPAAPRPTARWRWRPPSSSRRRSVTLKDPKDWKIAGKPLKRLDTLDKLTGKQVYGADLKLPGMLNAAIKECPVQRGKIKSFDAAKVANMPGVKKVVQVGDSGGRRRRRYLVAGQDRARRASDRLGRRPEHQGLERQRSPNGSRPASTRRRRSSAIQNGDAKAALAGAAKKVEAVYAYPYQNHACMEPMNATARYTPDKCEVWGPTQNGEAAFAAAVQASGLPADKCEVYKVHLGGGFGRRGAFHDYMTQAVLIAKEMPGTPVKLLWSREEDMAQGRFHPVMQCKLVGGFDADNNLTGLHLRLSGQSILADVRPEALAERTRSAHVPGPRPGRGACIRLLDPEPADRPRHAQSAHQAGVLARREHQPERHLHRMLHGRAGASGRPGRARVPAQADEQASAQSRRAQCGGRADRLGQARAARRLSRARAHEGVRQPTWRRRRKSPSPATRSRCTASSAPPICAYAVNPAQIDRQVAGSFVYGLSALFYQECTVKDGRIEQTNFDNYNSMRIAEMPKVESIILATGGSEPWGGIGEPTICVAAPAVLNAYFKATGKRIRSFPLKNHNIQMA